MDFKLFFLTWSVFSAFVLKVIRRALTAYIRISKKDNFDKLFFFFYYSVHYAVKILGLLSSNFKD